MSKQNPGFKNYQALAKHISLKLEDFLAKEKFGVDPKVWEDSLDACKGDDPRSIQIVRLIIWIGEQLDEASHLTVNLDGFMPVRDRKKLLDLLQKTAYLATIMGP